MQVLVTGATGLVGFETVEQLRAADVSATVVGTSRHGSPGDPSVIRWDMANHAPPAQLRRPWDVIVHAAADTRWTLAPEEATAANVATVEALSEIAGNTTHIVHISTAYALGLRGSVSSPDIGDYRNSYEWSKAHSERVATERFPRLSIIRPPLIIGRRRDGRAARFAGMYTVLRAMTASMAPVIIAASDSWFDVIPVDDLAALILTVACNGPGCEVLTLAGGTAAPTVDAAINVIAKTVNGWRTEHDVVPLPCPPVIDPERFERFFLPFARRYLSPRQLKVLELLRNFEPYTTITEPLEPTHTVGDVEPAIAAAVRYWAETHPRQASLAPRQWKAVS